MRMTCRARRLCAAIVSIAVLGGATTMAAPQKPRTTKTAPRKTVPRKTPAKPKAAPPVKPAPAPRVELAVPFRAGETLSYDVSWSTAYMTAGTATLSVRDKRASYGSTAYYIVGEARPTPGLAKLYSLYYKADTLLDTYTLLPQRGSVYSDENGRKRMKTLRFDQDARTAQFEMQTKTLMQKDLTVPLGVQDALSVLYVLRAMTLKPGARVSMPVCLSDVVYQVTATVGSREDVKTGLGTRAAYRITPVVTDAAGRPAGRGMSLWLSDDAQRLPLRLQTDLAVGSFNLVLREAK
jgi:hypothetical protein